MPRWCLCPVFYGREEVDTRVFTEEQGHYNNIILIYYVHKIPNPFSLSRENVGRSRSSVTIGFVRCQLLRTGCYGAPVLFSTRHWCGFICAARAGKDVSCISIGKGRTPLAEILVEPWCAAEHVTYACNLARIPTSHGLVEH